MFRKAIQSTARSTLRRARKFSTDPKLETEIHAESKRVIKQTTKDGYFEQVITTITRPSPRTKVVMGLYGAGFLGTSMQTTYNAGKSELTQYRKKHPNGSGDKDEFTVVKEACGREIWNSIWSGLWWPATLTSRLMPNVILWLNPEPVSEKPSKPSKNIKLPS